MPPEHLDAQPSTPLYFEQLEPRWLASATPLSSRAKQPVISVADASVIEGTGGSSVLSFVFTRTGNAKALNLASSVTYETRGVAGEGGATAGADFVSKTGQVKFQPGQTVKIVRVNVVTDNLFEGGSNTVETMKLLITGSTGARTPDTEAIGTIRDDDRRPRISVADTYIVEGDAGFAVMRFTVRLTNPSAQSVSVDFATADGTAVAGVDYIGRTGTLTFAPGQSSLTVDVNVPNNLGAQGHRAFDLKLSNAKQATLTRDLATGTIIDDEGIPVLLLTDISVKEQDSGLRVRRITVTLSHAGAAPATVFVSTQDGTAKANADYIPISGTLPFAAGTTSASFKIAVINDTKPEPTEAFNIVFSSPTNLELLDTRLMVTIKDND
jgi:hypothetical protein